jgi:glutaredoxin-like YruB-family protein
MENISSYNELNKRLLKTGKSVLLLYKSGSEQSQCALNNIEVAMKEVTAFHLFIADVSVVRDIHENFGVTSVPSLLVFEDGNLSGVVKGCQDPEFYRAVTENDIFRNKSTQSAEKPAKNVTVYSTPTCSWCNTLKTWLNKNNIRFRDIDVSADQRAAEELVRRSGQQGVPQTDINGRIVVGFDQAKLKELLEIH